jgi:hypothetical protein
MFAQSLSYRHRIPGREFAAYGASGTQIASMRARFGAWESAGTFSQARDIHRNPLRSRERRFESCRGHQFRSTNSNTVPILDIYRCRACDLRKRGSVLYLAPYTRPDSTA